MRIIASAPGKLVILGEYAVLEGAPALVQAVNRRAQVTLTPGVDDAWEIVSPTLNLAARLTLRQGRVEWLAATSPELAWVATLIEGFACIEKLPACRLELDSDAFYLEHAATRAKLGLGSSAALTVALLGALHTCAGLPTPTLAECIDIHRAIQGGQGSGIDVAASLAGGLTRFQLDGHTARTLAVDLPAGLHWCCVYSGQSASTRAMLDTVAAWRANASDAYAQHMHELATISSRGIHATTTRDATAFLSCLHDYAQALACFGEAAGADIASQSHRALGALAQNSGCVYKSCGAGGGDVGVTFAVDNTRLRECTAHIAQAGFPVLGLKADPQGLHVVSKV